MRRAMRQNPPGPQPAGIARGEAPAANKTRKPETRSWLYGWKGAASRAFRRSREIHCSKPLQPAPEIPFVPLLVGRRRQLLLRLGEHEPEQEPGRAAAEVG